MFCRPCERQNRIQTKKSHGVVVFLWRLRRRRCSLWQVPRALAANHPVARKAPVRLHLPGDDAIVFVAAVLGLCHLLFGHVPF